MWEDSFLIHKVELVAIMFFLEKLFFTFPWTATKDNFPLSRMSGLESQILLRHG